MKFLQQMEGKQGRIELKIKYVEKNSNKSTEMVRVRKENYQQGIQNQDNKEKQEDVS